MSSAIGQFIIALIIAIGFTGLIFILIFGSYYYLQNNVKIGYGYTGKEALEYCESIGYEYYRDIDLDKHFNCCREEIVNGKFEKVCVAGK